MVQANDPRGEASAQILESLLTIGRAARKRLDSGSDQVGYWVVHMLSQLGPTRNRDLAAACGLDASTVSRQVRSLEEAQLIDRCPDPADGRAHLVSLSSEGSRRVAEAKARRLGIVTERLADWSPDDVITLAALLSRLAREIAPVDGLGPEQRDSAYSSDHNRQD
ncbi:MarR family winged helix-turn-helix transcriptional regulator [Granulicoccus sp. GXG6511]|uniref:MarR family winged helix-turn-helix transcriptional regulator n=1 Tax=Granulicoccus sp. GXG6511 TaxID=3381351 RepID=UPI003D7D542C